MEYKIKWWARKSTQEMLGKIGTVVILSVGGVVVLIPLVWMLSTSLKDNLSVFLIPPQWIPRPLLWRNFVDALTILPFGLYIKNTAIITFSNIIGQLISVSLVAFGFSRLRAPGRDFLFILVLSTMMLPRQVTMIPVFIIFRALGWVNTFKPLIIPAFFGGSAFAIFLLRQFYMTIPVALDDAARIDGCSSFDIYWRIILPLAKPALATVSIFAFMYHWNDFMTPLIYINSMEKYTISLGLSNFSVMRGLTEWNLLMAASLVTLLPCVFIFFFAQRYFIRGIVMTGIKG